MGRRGGHLDTRRFWVTVGMEFGLVLFCFCLVVSVYELGSELFWPPTLCVPTYLVNLG